MEKRRLVFFWGLDIVRREFGGCVQDGKDRLGSVVSDASWLDLGFQIWKARTGSGHFDGPGRFQGVDLPCNASHHWERTGLDWESWLVENGTCFFFFPVFARFDFCSLEETKCLWARIWRYGTFG